MDRRALARAAGSVTATTPLDAAGHARRREVRMPAHGLRQARAPGALATEPPRRARQQLGASVERCRIPTLARRRPPPSSHRGDVRGAAPLLAALARPRARPTPRAPAVGQRSVDPRPPAMRTRRRVAGGRGPRRRARAGSRRFRQTQPRPRSPTQRRADGTSSSRARPPRRADAPSWPPRADQLTSTERTATAA